MYRLTFGRMESSRTRNASKASETKKRVQNALAIASLFGLTWVFGLFSLIHEDAAFTFQILFCIFNSLQGLFVFVMFCLNKAEIRAIWRVWFRCQNYEDKHLMGVSLSEPNSLATGKTGSSAVHDISSSQM